MVFQKINNSTNLWSVLMAYHNNDQHSTIKLYGLCTCIWKKQLITVIFTKLFFVFEKSVSYSFITIMKMFYKSKAFMLRCKNNNSVLL